MQSLALVSGLIGALLSSGLSYLVRLTLDRRSKREAEARLAYVHAVRISELVALEIAVKSIVKSAVQVYGIENAGEALKGDGDSFEPSHKISVLIAQELQKITPEKLRDTPSLSTIPLFIRAQLDALNESKLTADQLSNLPRHAVLDYSIFLNYLASLRGALLLWINFFEDHQVTWATPESIHDQWIAVTKFFGQASKLRVTLMVAGAMTRSEAAALLAKQIAVFNETFVAKLQHQPKLRAAMDNAKAAEGDPPRA
jgi:hypothetical protein